MVMRMPSTEAMASSTLPKILRKLPMGISRKNVYVKRRVVLKPDTPGQARNPVAHLWIPGTAFLSVAFTGMALFYSFSAS
jgi:hypothetical protein